MDLTQQDRERLKVVDAEYTVESEGHQVPQPIVHLFCRDEDRNKRIVEVEGFRPYFYLRYDEFEDRVTDVVNDRHVIAIETDLSEFESEAEDFDDPDEAAEFLTQTGSCQVYHGPNTFDGLHGDQMVKVFTVEPSHVGKIREHFEWTGEADIPFTRRFLISSGIDVGCSVPEGAKRVRYENWDGHSSSDGRVQEIRPEEEPEVEPRLGVVDIEVATYGEGFPEPDEARNEITAITAYDNYEDDYACWALESEEWDEEHDFESAIDERLDIEMDSLDVFDHEGQMIEDFHQWVLGRDFDMMSGWNTDFDYPYIIQRSYNTSAYSIRDWDYFDTPFVAGNDDPSPVVDGLVIFDMLEAYKKTQYRELESYRLDDVAEAELGYGKEQLGEDFDDAWHYHPVDFIVYNVRDVEAVVEIEDGASLVDLYDNMRDVTGALYNTCHHNGPMLDTLFLRSAYEESIVLPTNEEVPPEEGNYPGAKVFNVKPGVHKNSVYPDLSSLYPNLFAMLNLGSETIVGTKEDLDKSEYTHEDVFRAPNDFRGFKTVPKGEEYEDVDKSKYKGVLSEDGELREMFDPKYEDLYVLKPEVEESFVRSTVDDLIELKYKYTGERYKAVKRVCNSVYGVAGDSKSAGKGFRLFDKRVAEGITLAGRKTIEHTAEEFTGYINDHYDEEAYLVGGDTDASVTSIPNADTPYQTQSWAEEAVEYVDESYDEFVQNEFEMDESDEHRLEVELESIASSLFYMIDEDAENPHETGVKKRYAQHVVWDDDDGWVDLPDSDETDYDVLEDPEDKSDIKYDDNINYDTYENVMVDEDPTDSVEITGFEYVRSDAATITKEAQERILTDILLADDATDRIYDYLSPLHDDILDGDVPIEKLGRPKGIGNPLDDYGWKTTEELENDTNYTVRESDRQNGGRYVATPGPTYRGRKYAVDHFDWEDGDQKKCMRLYVDTVRGDEYPAAYEYDEFPREDRPDSPEVGRDVDAITVEYVDRVPDTFIFDREKMMEKELRSKTENIIKTVGEEWDGIVGKGRQTGLDQFG